MSISNLKDRWLSLSVISDKPLLDEMFNAIAERYAEPHRYYHNMEHIKSCLDLLDLIKGGLNNPEFVEMALWFHDVIYNPRKNDNEEQSALFAKELLSRIGAGSAIVNRVSNLILATKHPYCATIDEEQYIVDIDLAVLGASPIEYELYSEQIQKEYCHVPGLLFKRGRLKVLQAFLNQDAIYNTEYFYSKLENKARDNLEREIEFLKQELAVTSQ
jgi:predicted metal-dependent HD superfamily phosphohydrolase